MVEKLPDKDSGQLPFHQELDDTKYIAPVLVLNLFLLRQTFVEWTNHSRNHSLWASKFYDEQRRNGKRHQVAIRALAFKWIRIMYRCWKERQPYDEAKYLLSLKKKSSPLVKNLTAEAA